MATTVVTSNHYKFQLMSGNINLASDSLKAILMDSSFVFDKDTHSTLADVTANQLATKNGYTQNSHAFTTPSIQEDDSTDKARYSCDDLTITATAADDATGIGPIGGYCIYDDTTSDDTIICFVDFGDDYTISAGSSIQIQNVVLTIS